MIQKIKNNKLIHIIYRILEFIVFGSLILYVLMISFQRFSNNSSILGYRIFTVASGSMEPAYQVGDVILVKNTPSNEFQVGDVVSYLGSDPSVSGMIITHRIIDIDSKNDGTLIYTTQGDANQIADPSIDASQIYGKVITKLTFFTVISNIVHNQFGFFFLIFIPIVLFIFLEIADTIMDMKEDKKEEDSSNEE